MARVALISPGDSRALIFKNFAPLNNRYRAYERFLTVTRISKLDMLFADLSNDKSLRGDKRDADAVQRQARCDRSILHPWGPSQERLVQRPGQEQLPSEQL